MFISDAVLNSKPSAQQVSVSESDQAERGKSLTIAREDWHMATVCFLCVQKESLGVPLDLKKKRRRRKKEE